MGGLQYAVMVSLLAREVSGKRLLITCYVLKLDN
jgi:hypothetical protein